MRPPVVKGDSSLAAVFSSAFLSGAKGRAAGPGFVSGSDTERGPAPNTYRGSRPVSNRPSELSFRDLETHSFPRAVPVKDWAERIEASSSYATGSGEGQNRRDHLPVRRVVFWSGATIQSMREAARSSAECRLRGRCHRQSGVSNGTTPAHSVTTPVRRVAWPPPPIRRPGTSSCRIPFPAGACSRPPVPSCGPGWKGPWTFRASFPGAACTSAPPGWPGGRERRPRRRPI